MNADRRFPYTTLVRETSNPGGKHGKGGILGTIRWQLVRWLTGGTIEATPMRFDVYGDERVSGFGSIVVQLGQPGAVNTADYVKPEDTKHARLKRELGIE